VIAQIREVTREPVWRHPGLAPLDFLVEDVAQMAVRSLRIRDEHRRERLENLAWRFELMFLDLRQAKQLLEIARFVDGAHCCWRTVSGCQSSSRRWKIRSPEDLFAGMLTAICEAGNADEAQPPGDGRWCGIHAAAHPR
jgi:hypothetical protein